jgi:glucosylceramidase
MSTARVRIFFLGIALLALACSKGLGGTTGTGGNPGTGGSPCSGTQTACGTDCIDTSSDPTNCGGCGIPCSTGQVCQNGACQCQAGLMLCNGSCVASDATHCGSCATTCQTGQVCSNGACISSCDGTGLTLCGSSCVDPSTSNTSCGGCGTTCGSTQHCAGAVCVPNVTTGTGGTPGTGGATATGGTPGTGGKAGAGGTTGAGGSGGNGGTTGAGGSATGGAPGTGGTAPALSSVVTSASGSYWKSGTLTTVTSGTATVTVTDTSVAQTWEGFGGAFNELGWSYLSMLSPTDRDSAIRLLFGSDGAHFNFGRVPIGANDFAVSRYTDDEVSSGTDYSMASFSIDRDKMYIIPFIKAAQAVNGSLRFWGSPWTPPTWMKTSSGSYNGTACTFSGTAFDSGCMMDNAQVLTAYAQYFVKWVQGYAAQGITIEAIAPQNEPNYFTNYPSCGWTPALFTKFVGQYLGPAVASASLTTKIMLGTMSNGDSGKDPSIVSAVLADATAKGFTKVFGYQWNMLPDVGSAKSSNLPIWQTEHKCGNYPWNPAGFPAFNASTAPNDYAYGVESWGNIHDWIAAGVTAYNAWNTVLDTAGKSIDSVRPWPQNALLTVNTSTKALTITPAYYVFRHCSQYVSAGAKVVATSGSGSSLGFKNPDGSIVTVMYNSGSASTYNLAVGGKKLQFAMPANGFATVVYVP